MGIMQGPVLDSSPRIGKLDLHDENFGRHVNVAFQPSFVLRFSKCGSHEPKFGCWVLRSMAGWKWAKWQMLQIP